MAKLKIRKDDTVVVMSGKNKGSEGKILRAYPNENKVIVENVNKVKKHMRPTQDNPNGGINEKEAPISASSVMLVCPNCNEPTRVGYELSKTGKKRICKKCKKTF
ncbi:MAG: 50S ribosomal protein L24 [Coriobacteriia bacterium]|nr:50S ribosomal protein L24 [Coriobacteriia bacterium]